MKDKVWSYTFNTYIGMIGVLSVSDQLQFKATISRRIDVARIARIDINLFRLVLLGK